MDEMYKLELLASAQRELEEIARVHFKLVGPISAKKVTDRIYTALEKLKTYTHFGIACRDKKFAANGYHMLICGNYLCFYSQIAPLMLACRCTLARWETLRGQDDTIGRRLFILSRLHKKGINRNVKI